MAAEVLEVIWVLAVMEEYLALMDNKGLDLVLVAVALALLRRRVFILMVVRVRMVMCASIIINYKD